MERLILDQILELCSLNKFFSCDQHGFQNMCSCVTQLLECLNSWTSNFDEGIETDVIYLDFAKAFDTVPHQRLILKLRRAGIRGKVVSWVESFLRNRRQRVVLRNGHSNWREVISGVPQESILGPILFLIYVNDIPDSLMATAKMFADDTKVYNKIKSLSDCEALQEDLNRLSNWSDTWLIKFNESKCVVLKIKQSLEYIYTLNGSQLCRVDGQRDLGVEVAESLKPAGHIAGIVKKANQMIGLINRCFTGLDVGKVTVLYRSVVRPILEYGSPAWSPWLRRDIEALEAVQRRCFRVCHDRPNIESLELRRRIADLSEVYKYMHGLYRSRSSQFFSHPRRELRGHSLKLHKERVNTDIRKHFFSNRVVDSWNGLPE